MRLQTGQDDLHNKDKKAGREGRVREVTARLQTPVGVVREWRGTFLEGAARHMDEVQRRTGKLTARVGG